MTGIYKTPKYLHIQECDTDGNVRTVKYYREDIINGFVARVAGDLQRIRNEADEPQTDIDCDRYVITNDEGERAYNCIGCQTDCPWK